jgi:hypothetical protein
MRPLVAHYRAGGGRCSGSGCHLLYLPCRSTSARCPPVIDAKVSHGSRDRVHEELPEHLRVGEPETGARAAIQNEQAYRRQRCAGEAQESEVSLAVLHRTFLLEFRAPAPLINLSHVVGHGLACQRASARRRCAGRPGAIPRLSCEAGRVSWGCPGESCRSPRGTPPA